ncbi:TrbC/VirB2 family protein [Hydrogenophaga sp. PAMC20947]|uniref:TrbC/VirB2 family protein n=1 Tax=Hydrogenophaga sp. PAMC20947 TaxID=2565558 RepID=UPI00109D8478|nr:TrbC/VirB2 family protein [Hydrogenophaga sp. PAMC20947]QCB45669.1 type VI secretion protein [Hydrogenophaga sp. PAMC20947]
MNSAWSLTARQELKILTILSVCVFLTMASPEAWAVAAGFEKACANVSDFFTNFETILRVASVSIVTIAVVFAGYQIAFAHKRLSDVAPILIGGLLIGGAATVAGWFVSGWSTENGSGAQTTCAVTNTGG